jgi:tRNA dimethylallyltransferase
VTGAGSTAALPALLVLAGPTATGKTALAIRLALALRDEGVRADVVSADSRQVFRGLDIGTAKPTPTERAGVPHHGLDLVEPDAAFSVADFADHVAGVLPSIAAADGLAILAGGTGLWLRAVARGLELTALPHDPGVRAEVETAIAERGLPAAAERLRTLAPTRAAAIDLANPRRVARALEIAELVGDRPLPPPRGYGGPTAWLGLDVQPATHRAWIGERARAQFGAGLVDEARTLRERFDPALPCFTAIGYREAWAVLDGRLTLDAAIDEDAARNVAFARRQRTWLRREADVAWLDPSLTDPLPITLATAHGLLAAPD